VAQAAATGAAGGDAEAALAQALLESGIGNLAPDGEDAAGAQGTIRGGDGAAAVEGIVTAVAARMRSLVKIEDDGVEGRGGNVLDHCGDIGEGDSDPRVGGGRGGEGGEGSFTPVEDDWVELGDGDGRRGRERIEDGAQGETHAETADQDPWCCGCRQAGTGELAENDLGAVGEAVHQHQSADGDEKIAGTALAQFQHTFGGSDAVENDPGLRHVRTFGQGRKNGGYYASFILALPQKISAVDRRFFSGRRHKMLLSHTLCRHPGDAVTEEPTAKTHPFARLSLELVMDAVESRGYRCDCRTLTLNSYENRVYQVGIEEGEPLVAKFYRPGRWSDAQIEEEHHFSLELVEHELPVVPPLPGPEGKTLFHFDGFRFALYRRQGGHAPEFDNLDNLLILGRLLGRLHAIGALRPFAHRPRLDLQSFGSDSVTFISERCVPVSHKANYDALSRDLLQAVAAAFAAAGEVRWLRTHGDCHAGNILWRDQAPHLVDLDDARLAPAVQDLWMMLSGDRPRQQAQLAELLDGYGEFYDFQPRELRLIEALRSLRLLHYAAWIGRRWDDPTFPHHFAWFGTPRYWDEQILMLREQLAALAEHPLQAP